MQTVYHLHKFPTLINLHWEKYFNFDYITLGSKQQLDKHVHIHLSARFTSRVNKWKICAIKLEFLDSSLSGSPFQLFKTWELQFCSYQAGVPEHETMEFTGHRSIESVRRYKRQNEEILHNIFKALEPKWTDWKTNHGDCDYVKTH